MDAAGLINLTCYARHPFPHWRFLVLQTPMCVCVQRSAVCLRESEGGIKWPQTGSQRCTRSLTGLRQLSNAIAVGFRSL